MQGLLQVVQNNKKNTSLRVQIDGQWFSAKFSTGLKPADVGQFITATLGANEFPPGSGVMWIDDYQFQNAATTPASQAMDQAMQQQAATPVGQAGQYEQVPRGTPQDERRFAPNKDSMIGAFALCKCCTPGTPDQAFENFVHLYHKLEGWDSSITF